MESDKTSDGSRTDSAASPNLDKSQITPEYVRNLNGPSDRMFCKLKDNDKVRFGQYKIRDYTSGMDLMHITEEQQIMADKHARQEEEDGNIDLNTRTIKYHFGPHFLDLQTLALSLEFFVEGEEPIKDLLLIERHYYGDKLLSAFEFQFPFCMPKSKNEWEFVYDLPKLASDEKQELIESPWETFSDSYFFADGQLIVHNKACYSYA